MSLLIVLTISLTTIISVNPQDSITHKDIKEVKKEMWHKADSVSVNYDYLIHKLDSLKGK